MTSDQLYYAHSGRFSPVGAITGLFAGALASIPLAFVYAYAIVHIPFIYLNLFICFGFGFAVGFIAARTMAILKVRNPGIMMGLTMLAMLVGFYASWVAWIYALLRQREVDVSFFSILQSPAGVWQTILYFNENGAWSISRSSEPVTGILLWAVWAIEAGILFFAASLAVKSTLARPFCEECETWCVKRPALASLRMTDEADGLVARVGQKDFSLLKQVGPRQPEDPSWFELNLHNCPGCGKTNALTMKLMALSVDKKGNTSTTETILHGMLVLTPEQTVALLDACASLEAGAETADTGAPATPA